MDQATLNFDQSLCEINTNDPEEIRCELIRALVTMVGRDPVYAQERDWYAALAFLLRGILSHYLAESGRKIHETGAKRIYYLSLEYLPERMLPKVLLDLGITENVKEALRRLGLSLDTLVALETDMGLGNGGLGRLAACFLDSLATHRYPGFGYGIRYEFGLFSQAIENGQQVEHPEPWLRYGDPWQFRRPTITYPIRFHGRLQRSSRSDGRDEWHWVDGDNVTALAYDLPISGYRSNTVLYLRLWAASASRDFDLRYFNEGDYVRAVQDKTISESLSKVLYPNDSTAVGQELRLKQEYFFVSASLQDILRRHLKSNPNLNNLEERVAIQLNDTHPALAIPEMMRLLVDQHNFKWEDAWSKTTLIFGYTNHTLLPEALETWPIAMLEGILPRHLQIIYQINEAHLAQVKEAFPGEMRKLRQMSLVDDSSRRIRMAHLAIVGSHRVNGVSQLQTRLLREMMFADFEKMSPNRFLSITNGITQRLWLLTANPDLARAITARIGDAWTTRLEHLETLSSFVDDEAFRNEIQRVKANNKARLASFIRSTVGETIDPHSMFDIQVKRIHEYKRQLLNVLHVVSRYRRIKEGDSAVQPRSIFIGGKAAPGYDMAKHIIQLICDVARTINNDPETRDLLKLLFIPDYKVSVAEVVIPAADLAQHISTAGTEASGTGNMKFAMNGALTLGTLDGANIEISDAVGEQNIFLFGMNAEQVSELRAKGYDAWTYYEEDKQLKACIDMIGGGYFSPDEPNRHAVIRDSILSGGDHFCVLADYRSYMNAQDRIDSDFSNPDNWAHRTILNISHMGRFSSDRAIHQYAEKIWAIKSL